VAEPTAPSVKLYLDQTMAEAEMQPIAGGLAAVYSSRCPGKESPNEDGAALIPLGESSGLLVVADGVGGARAGQEAASMAIRELQHAVERALEEDLPARTAILNGFENASKAIQELGFGAGSTLAVVEVQDDTVRTYHAGDSMVLVVGSRGKVKLQTVSHSPVGFAVESGLLDEVEAMHHEDRHLISNALGMAEMRIEIGPSWKLAARDTVLLASDGLFDNLHTEEIVAELRRGPLARVAEALASHALERMVKAVEGQPSKPDDLTFLAFRRSGVNGGGAKTEPKG